MKIPVANPKRMARSGVPAPPFDCSTIDFQAQRTSPRAAGRGTTTTLRPFADRSRERSPIQGAPKTSKRPGFSSKAPRPSVQQPASQPCHRAAEAITRLYLSSPTIHNITPCISWRSYRAFSQGDISGCVDIGRRSPARSASRGASRTVPRLSGRRRRDCE